MATTPAAGPTTPGRAAQTAIYRAGAVGSRPRVPVAAAALREKARRSCSRAAWGYLEGSAGAEATAAANREALDRRRVAPRMLRDVAVRDLSAELFGDRMPAPLLLSPIGVLEMVHPLADLAVARAARLTGVPMVVSSQASAPMEQIAAELRGSPWWFQLYWSNDDAVTASFVARAEAAGARAIVVTVDTHTLGWRPRDLDNGFLPFARGQGIAQYTSDPAFMARARRRAQGPAPETPRVSPRGLPTALRTLVTTASRVPAGGSLVARLRSPLPRAAVDTFLEVFSRPSLTWDDVAGLCGRTRLPVVVKGIQSAADAERAVAAGARGVWVSNHGGRQVDGAIGALDALGPAVAAVAARVPVVFDSGVRGGADVLKALALGATAVGIGRPYVYGLAVGGARGVADVVSRTVAELDLTMGLSGLASVSEVDEGVLAPAAATRPQDAAHRA